MMFHIKVGGAMRDRTADLLRARQALSQLSYNPSNWSYILATFTSAFGLLTFGYREKFMSIKAKLCDVCLST